MRFFKAVVALVFATPMIPLGMIWGAMCIGFHAGVEMMDGYANEAWDRHSTHIKRQRG